MPSTARTVYLPVPVPTNTETPGIVSSEPELAWPTKAPGDALDFTLDCTAWLNDAGGDTINPATVAITIAPNDMTASAPTFTSTALTWTFSAGTASASLYAVTIIFSTVGGLTVDRTIFMPMAILSPLQGNGGQVTITLTAALYQAFLSTLPNAPPGVWNNAGVATSS